MGIVKSVEILAATYFIMSLFTFYMYAKDKSAARNRTWRTKENTLHLLALFCGWPGAFMAQRMLRHKSSKQPFRLIFWLTVILNIGVCAGLVSHLI